MLIHKTSLTLIKVTWLRQILSRDEDVGEESCAEHDAVAGRGGDAAVEDLVTERTEDDETEGYVDVDEAGAVTDETFGGGEEVIEADAEADFLDDL